VARERDEVLPALDRFFELHALRANMARGPKHPNYFADRSLQEFLRDICNSLAARDAVRVFQLRIGTETLVLYVRATHANARSLQPTQVRSIRPGQAR
jgi:CelD/BcsL family acetyltransferase involved in cellulose biosynthesis